MKNTCRVVASIIVFAVMCFSSKASDRSTAEDVRLDHGQALGASFFHVHKTRRPVTYEAVKLIASDPEEDDYFGYSVSISEDTLIVSAPGDEPPYSVSVFDRDHGGPDQWGEVAKLTGASTNDGFGDSVSIDGDTVVIGASSDMHSGIPAGSAYVFERHHGGPDNWGEIAKLTGSDPEIGDTFGASVSIDGDTIVIGASERYAYSFKPGSAYVFQRNLDRSAGWHQVAKLTASDGDDYDLFGVSVSISGDTVVVGASHDDHNGRPEAGSAYVFERHHGGPDNWGQVVKLEETNPQVAEYFGGSVSISGNTVVVGAPRSYRTGFGRPGAAFVFERNFGGPGRWGEVATLLAADLVEDDYFGYSVSISGDTVVAGAYLSDPNGAESAGSAYVFKRSQWGGNNWAEVIRLIASDPNAGDFLGFSVAVSGDTAVTGALSVDYNGFDFAGAAYVFGPLEFTGLSADGFESGDFTGWSTVVD